MDIDEPIGTFKLSFSQPFAFVITWAVSLFIAVILLTEGRQVCIVALAAAIGVLIPLGAIVVAVTNHYFKVRVYTYGLKGHDSVGRGCEIKWAEIETVPPFVLRPGLKFLRVSGAAGSRVLWLPLFLTHFDLFKELVVQHAPQGNPLASYLRATELADTT